MKRGTPDHPKVDELMAALSLRRWGAVGILESLWHFTARYAPQGDVGKFTNAAIASRLDFDREPDILITALIKCRWLDESRVYRLVVHDWQDHADQTVTRFLESNSLCYVNASSKLEKVTQKKAALGYGTGTGYGKGGVGENDVVLPVAMEPARPAIIKWLRYKAEKKQAYKTTGFATWLKEWEAKGAERTIAAIEHSMAQNWAGCFEKSERRGGGARPWSTRPEVTHAGEPTQYPVGESE